MDHSSKRCWTSILKRAGLSEMNRAFCCWALPQAPGDLSECAPGHLVGSNMDAQKMRNATFGRMLGGHHFWASGEHRWRGRARAARSPKRGRCLPTWALKAPSRATRSANDVEPCEDTDLLHRESAKPKFCAMPEPDSATLGGRRAQNAPGLTPAQDAQRGRCGTLSQQLHI